VFVAIKPACEKRLARRKRAVIILRIRRKDTMESQEKTASIAIFCREMKIGGDPFSSDYYYQAYLDLLLALKARGLQAYLVTDNNSYEGFGTFTTAYTTDDKTPIDKLSVHHNVHIDLVFDRGGFIGRDVATINPSILLKMGNNKIEMYKHFGELQPFSVICESRGDVEKAFEKIEGDKIVVKEPDGCGGKQVYIGPKKEILEQLPNTFPVLAQEFLDTSGGVPGYINGVHDVRLSICGGEIIGYYVRSAKEGSLHSNVSRGGKMFFFDVSHVPEEVKMAAMQIDEQFKNFPRYYAADFIHTPKGWKMLELNPYLALLPVTDGEEARRTLAKLTDYLATHARDIRANAFHFDRQTILSRPTANIR
jgi:glutathione synthase/RimK-type ligase-like ATP-grasp enzyme